MTSYLTGSNAIEPAGARAFKINGVPIVIRGGGFDPNLFLHYSAADTAKQIALMKNMGVNTIRLEGHLMPDDWFQQMDQAGILVNAGFQCCDAWQLSQQPDRGATTIMQNSALAIGSNLRNHPSVFSFQWSDNAADRQQESVSLTGFSQADFYQPDHLLGRVQVQPALGPPARRKAPTTGCRRTTGTTPPISTPPTRR